MGCNRGHNLVLLSTLFHGSTVVGIDPNLNALSLAQADDAHIDLVQGHSFDIPFKDESFDLAFTCGVLIHIALPDLPAALKEIYRVTCRYILAVEYFAEQETAIHYRGYDDLLWKRDFLEHYRKLFPDLALLRTGTWDKADGFDACQWWLMEKHA